MALIPTLVPSCDRASQLFTLLESISTNCPDVFDITVLTRWRNDDYARGYMKLLDMIEQKNYPYPAKNIQFVAEDDCCKDFYDWLNSIDYRYMALFVDDCIFYRPLHPYGELTEILDKRSDVWNLTLRVGTNTYVHCYQPGQELYLAPIEVEEEISGRSNIPPSEIIYTKYIKWDFTKGNPHQNTFFSVGWDGIIFRTDEYKNLLQNHQFTNLRNVEEYTNTGDQRKKYVGRYKYMVAPEKSCVFSAQFNCTHDRKGYYGGVSKCEPEEFNQRLLNGEVLDWQSMNLCENVKGCHWEPYPLKWKNLNNITQKT